MKKLTIIMPTYNAARTLDRCLATIRSQSYPRELVEILVVDGGSMDDTIRIAEKYGCRILDNPARLPETAKRIGLEAAEGDYALYIDSDEYFVNPDSLALRVAFLQKHPQVKVLTSTGKISLPSAGAVTKYSNYVSDPFSFFMYRLDGNDRAKELRRKYRYEEMDGGLIFQYGEGELLPLFDAAANMFDLGFVKELYAKSSDQANFAANIFENAVGVTRCSGMLADDFIYHDPAETASSFGSKMRWRVYNNVFRPADEGIGFASRKEANDILKGRKAGYVLYSCLILPVLLHSIGMAFAKRDIRFLMHFWFNELVMFWIGIYMICKLCGKQPARKKGYGKRAAK